MSRRLNEQESDSPVAGMLQDEASSIDSVDNQIDSLIIRYESESIKSEEEKTEEEKMLESLSQLTLGFLLEQDEEPSAESPAASTATKSPSGPDEEKSPIDIDLFTQKIARLVMNAHSLLRIEEAIVARAMSFLEKNHGKDYVDRMQDILDNQYDFDLSGEEDVVDVPIAAGAAGKSAGG